MLLGEGGSWQLLIITQLDVMDRGLHFCVVDSGLRQGGAGGGGGSKRGRGGLTHCRRLFIVSPKIEHLTPFKERARRSVIRPKVLHLVCKPNAALMKKMGRKDDKISMLFAPHSDDDGGDDRILMLFAPHSDHDDGGNKISKFLSIFV